MDWHFFLGSTTAVERDGAALGDPARARPLAARRRLSGGELVVVGPGQRHGGRQRGAALLRRVQPARVRQAAAALRRQRPPGEPRRQDAARPRQRVPLGRVLRTGTPIFFCFLFCFVLFWFFKNLFSPPVHWAWSRFSSVVFVCFALNSTRLYTNWYADFLLFLFFQRIDFISRALGLV